MPVDRAVNQNEVHAAIQAFAEGVSHRFWETDADHRLLRVTESSRGLGSGANRWQGISFWEIEPDHLAPETIDLIRGTFHKQESFRDLTYVRNLPDGQRIFASISGVAKRDESGSFQGYLGTFNDLTRSALEQEEQTNSNRQLADAINNLDAGIAYWSPDRKFIFCNEAFRNLQGEGAKYLVPGTDMEDFLRGASQSPHFDLDDHERESWVQARIPDFSEGKTQEVEYVRKNGQVVYVRRELLEDGSSVTFHTDVTQGRMLERSRDELVAAMEELDIGILLWDADDRFIFCNDYYREMLGTDAAVLKPGVHIREFLEKLSQNPRFKLTEEEREDWIQQRLPVADEKYRENEFHHADGRWVSVRRQVMENGNSMVMHTNITERKQLEQAKDEFVAVASHELRTPLTSIMGAIGVLKSGAVGELSSNAMDMIEIAYQNCHRLNDLVSDILDLTKLENRSLELDVKPIDPENLVSECITLNADYAASHNCRLELVEAEKGLSVQGDFARLTQVLTNLISNASKFSPDDGVVELSIKKNGNMVRFGVRDHGPGIPAEFRSKIFDRFAQADATTTRSVDGTGLGLFISKEIVDLHGGKIDYLSTPGEGTYFYFELENRA